MQHGYWISRPGALLLAGGDGGAENTQAAYFRREFEPAQFERAELRIAAAGLYTLTVNGVAPDDRVLDPPPSDCARRVWETRYDVSRLLKTGSNRIEVTLGNGWYNSQWNVFQSYPRFRLELDADGRTVLRSDGAWRFSTGPIVFNRLRNGEYFDGRLRDVREWVPAEIVPGPGGVVEPVAGPPCRVTADRCPVAVDPVRGVYDFGENLAGRCRLRVRGERGATVVLRFGERLHPDGSVDQDHIGIFTPPPVQQDRYILRGDGDGETWEPAFNYHGFQYCQATVEGRAEILELTAQKIRTGFAVAGDFECSDETVNRLHHCFRNAFEANFVGQPTDCPHREKCGWTADAYLSGDAGLFNYDLHDAYNQWLRNFPDAQRPSGQLHGVIPYCGGQLGWESGAAWDAVAILLPELIYDHTGRTDTLELLFDTMTRYLEFCDTLAVDGILDYGIDDWGHPRSPNEHPWRERGDPAKASPALINTAFYYTALRSYRRIAGILNRAAVAPGSPETVREAFLRRFDRGDGRFDNGCQTAQGCALAHGLVPDSEIPAAVRLLRETVEANEFRVDYGVIGSRCVLRSLAAHGELETAWKMLTQSACPGYAHWLELGATALFEQWDGTKSRNHVMFGDFDAWLYRYVAGVSPVEPGFRRFRVAPGICGGLRLVRARHDSPFGPIAVEWRRDGAAFSLQVTVPPGTTAGIVLPDGSSVEAGPGNLKFKCEMRIGTK